MLTVHSLPELRSPVLLCAFGGWPDAGASASGALGFLSLKWPSRRFAEFDPDMLYSYTITRPVTSMSGEGRRVLHWPDLAWSAITLPQAPRDVVLLGGPEPDLRWRRCGEATVELAKRLGVELVVTLGCFGAPISHTDPPPLFARASDPAFGWRLEQLGFQDTAYDGPTSFSTALVEQFAQAGVSAASVWAAAPSYLRGAGNPKVSATLLAAVERVTGLSLELDELWAAGRDLEQRIDRALQERPELQSFVKSMQETEVEPEVEASPLPELPSPQAVLEDLETYLRELQQDKGTEE